VLGGGTDALNVFLPDWWVDKPDQSLENPRPDSGHYPYGRPTRGGWKKQPDGSWKSTVEDDKTWEVVCEQCGDDGGPVDAQPSDAKELRGPYASRHKAKHIADKHFQLFQM